MRLSAVIVTSPAERDSASLKRAMRSVRFADETIIFEIPDPIDDFAKARNSALAQARSEWVLFVDSDEEVTEALAEEIRQAIRSNLTGFRFKRNDWFIGKLLRHGETSRVRLLRLAKRDAGCWERPVHEVWRIRGSIGNLDQPLIHFSHLDLEGMLDKFDRYTNIEEKFHHLSSLAKFACSLSPSCAKATEGWPPTAASSPRKFANFANSVTHSSAKLLTWITLTEMIVYPPAKFVKNYLLYLGFLDGTAGFIHASLMSFHSFLVRAKQLQ